jgi:hypothetical protein
MWQIEVAGMKRDRTWSTIRFQLEPNLNRLPLHHCLAQVILDCCEEWMEERNQQIAHPEFRLKVWVRETKTGKTVTIPISMIDVNQMGFIDQRQREALGIGSEPPSKARPNPGD